jgi:multiple sugar transport system substrate-binding protein
VFDESNNTWSRREFLARGAAFGAAATGLGGLLSSCGTGTASGANAPVTMPIHTGPWLPSYQKMVSLYRKETGNRVELVPYPLQQVLSKQFIDTDAQSGKYDVYLVGESQAGEFYDGGFVTPLDEIDPGFEWPEGGLEYDGVCRWDGAKRYFSKSGKALGFPVVGLIELEFYRGDLYEKYDLGGPPETWEDVISNSKKIQKKEGSDLFGYLVRGERNGANWNYLSLLRGFGGDVFADPPKDWSVTIDSDEALAATEQWLELASYGPPEGGSVTQGTIIGLMQTGKALHTHITAAAILPFDDPEQSALPGKISATVVPKPAGGRHAPTSGIQINSIPAHISGERKRAAYDFIRWFMGREAQTKYARAHGIVTNQKVYDSKMVKEEHGMRALRAISKSVPYVRKGMDYVIGTEVATILDLRLNQIISKVFPPREGHRLMAEDLNKLLERSGLSS